MGEAYLKGVAKELYDSLEAITGVNPTKFPLIAAADSDFAQKAVEDIQDWAKEHYDIDVYHPKYDLVLEELDSLLKM